MNPLVVITAIQAVATAVSDACRVMLSPEGQAAMKQWREDGQEFRRVMNAIGAWFQGTFQFAVAAEVDAEGNPKVAIKATGGAKESQ